ncbi:hypothetical protein [Microbacterium sp. bgisy203]|uniref:hypothetical protein n=1 Tax=Microbacterium sp. bgisy203 TaxID=3413799 RepID=UPI003D74964E
MALGEGDVDAVWLDGGRMIALVTRGSSSAVPYASSVDATGQAVSVVLADPGGPATRDYVPRLTLVAVPEGVDPAQDVAITVTGAVRGSAPLPALAGAASDAPGTPTDGAPSAAWTSAEGQFVVLTWGSSRPPLVVADAEITGDDEVTVTFGPPSTPMATAGFAPRATLAWVPGAVARPTTLVLQGRADVDGARVAIVG